MSKIVNVIGEKELTEKSFEEIVTQYHFLEVLRNNDDIYMVDENLTEYPYIMKNYNKKTLICHENLDGWASYIDEVETVVILGKGLSIDGNESFDGILDKNLKKVIYNESTFLTNKWFLVEGSSFIIKNYDLFCDKENFIKRLKGKSEKIKELINNLVKLDDDVIVKFLIENNIIPFDSLKEFTNFKLSAACSSLILNAINNSGDTVKKNYDDSQERLSELSIGVIDYTLKDFKKVFNCDIEGDKIVLSKYLGKETIISIPSSVEGISKFEFKYLVKNSNIKELYFEEGITSLTVHKDNEKDVLCEYRNLIKIRLPKSLKHIDDTFFDGANINLIVESNNTTDNNFVKVKDNLVIFNNTCIHYNKDKAAKNVVVGIPDGITTLHSYLFRNFKGLQEVNLPNSINLIKEGTFSFSGLKTIIIPKEVTIIKEDTFKGCNKLTKITLHDKITNIEKRAFSSSGIKEITIPPLVTKITVETFDECGKLTKVILHDKITNIERGAFKSSGIKEITIPPLVTEINTETFSFSKLNKITLHDKITKIHFESFDYSDITEITIPSSVKELGRRTFAFCRALESIKLSDSLTVIDTETFSRSGIKDIIIPSSVEKLCVCTFEHCVNLVSVTLPDSIIDIAYGAFLGCTSLKNIIISSNFNKSVLESLKKDYPDVEIVIK
ncbi:MAG: leucine-rich repeat domain-containing protein [bacterium]